MSKTEQLKELLLKRSVRFGEFTLVSGAKSDFYVDSKQTTLHPPGAKLIGEVGLDVLLENDIRAARPVSIGGLTLGADPIALAIGMASVGTDLPLETVVVRKETKQHGTGRRIEGKFEPGDHVIVVDDVITTGGSSIQAIQAIHEAGGQVVQVLALVDRQEGGREHIENLGIRVVSIFTKTDLRSAATTALAAESAT